MAGISKAGIPTPVWATTHECRNSSGSENQLLTEVAIMATTLLKTYPKSLHPIFCQRICNARPAILAKFARISKNLTPRQRASLLKIGGVA
ncbi:ash family protein [Candidatus Williamhamiltonella defendens]|uniref:ash family protein n=2 Tax=Candidatus Williamhamiltonella defendens TaxID=138072 RepID=UPI00035E8983